MDQCSVAVPTPSPYGKVHRNLLLTLLFLSALGLHRTRDLRSYTGDALGLLTGRRVAYGYFHTERFLTHLVKINAAESFTDAVAKWTTQLWQQTREQEELACFYIDGHRKPVYTNRLIPRGRIGRTGKILGCRTLVLLHDEQGHPRLATTHRGDYHLTIGLPQILQRYEQVIESRSHAPVIVDREGMAACLLRDLKAGGWTVVTLLRANQYKGLESFTQVGAFVPLEYDQDGQVLREVAPACFSLSLPEPAGESLPLHVALIRDFRRLVPSPTAEPEDLDIATYWQDDWKAEPTAAVPTTAKLIAIVSTASHIDAVQLAQTYTRRWSAQENIIRDFLLPLGLDTNHGYGKAPVVNSEVAKKRASLSKRLITAKLRAASARDRSSRARLLSERLSLQTTVADHQYHLLSTLEEHAGEDIQRILQIQQEKARISAQREKQSQRAQQAHDNSQKESKKYEVYAQQQCDLLRTLEDITTQERTMYELDNRKDQVMTVFKLALANLAMWTRDQYFPDTYSNATWLRLVPFFRLPGLVTSNQHTVSVELRPFNDRQHTRDLMLLCQRINQKQPHLPDGRLLQFSVKAFSRPILHGQTPLIA